MSFAVQNPTHADWPAGVRLVDKRDWQNWFGKWFEEMGISASPLGAMRLQGMMRRTGILPEENLLSRGIIDMRDE